MDLDRFEINNFIKLKVDNAADYKFTENIDNDVGIDLIDLANNSVGNKSLDNSTDNKVTENIDNDVGINLPVIMWEWMLVIILLTMLQTRLQKILTMMKILSMISIMMKKKISLTI